jgi:hypothetical protein
MERAQVLPVPEADRPSTAGLVTAESDPEPTIVPAHSIVPAHLTTAIMVVIIVSFERTPNVAGPSAIVLDLQKRTSHYWRAS